MTQIKSIWILTMIENGLLHGIGNVSLGLTAKSEEA